MQVAVLLVFDEGPTVKEVRELVNQMVEDFNRRQRQCNQKDVRIQRTSIKDFNPDWGGVVIYQP